MNSNYLCLLAGAIAWAFVCQISAAAETEKTVYSFHGGSDGSWPEASLIDVDGTLYGTTARGGGGYCGCGTVFSIDPQTRTETIIYTFCSQQDCLDGSGPVASLIEVDGTLYGATYSGGNAGCYEDLGCGTVFSLNPQTGAETVLYSFCSQQNCADGAQPVGSLIDVNGILYGTTYFGGKAGCVEDLGCGTAFALDPQTGVETVLHTFCSKNNCADGAEPAAGFIRVKDKLYSTTEAGGTRTCRGEDAACGTVFSLDLQTGAEKVIHSFSGTDGGGPMAGLLDVDGTLYGTTGGGGDLGAGTVFSLNLASGSENVLYSFSFRDGAYPQSNLIDINGILYGTTTAGGGGYSNECRGCGIVFSLNPTTGAESVLYSFCTKVVGPHCRDGWEPIGGVVDVKGALYGTTVHGGAPGADRNCRGYGCGIVFVIRNP